ncbi:hypothetical protein D3C80_1665290 [compost metagenome]
MVLTLLVDTHLIAFDWLNGDRAHLIQVPITSRMLLSTDPDVVNVAGRILLVLLSLKSQHQNLAIDIDGKAIVRAVMIRLVVDSDLEAFSESAQFFSQLMLTDFHTYTQYLTDTLFVNDQHVASIVYSLANICNRENYSINSKQAKKELEIKLLQVREYVKMNRTKMHRTIAQLYQ